MTRPARSRPRSLAAVVSLAVLAATAILPASAMAGGQAPTHSVSAWVVVRDPGRTGEYAPAARDRGNSTGGRNKVERTWKGTWRIMMPGVGDLDQVQASAMGSKPRRCVPSSWGIDETYVQCFDYAGQLKDAPFVVTLTEAPASSGSLPGRLAYYWADVESADSTPLDTYQYSSKPGEITLDHRGTGKYRATIPKQGHATVVGTFQVSPYDRAGYCRIAGWSKGSGAQTVDIHCRRPAGALADTQHDLLFLRNLGIEGYGGGPSAYLFASKPTRTTSYKPAKATAWASNGKQATIKRSSKGVYRVTLPGMPKGGAALVTPYGTGTEDCQIGSIRTDKTPQQVVVRCFSKTGKPANAKFLLAYTK
ncbi:MAG: hypothetical protein KF809_06650 [Chloroflexi bacterium]|nr:hypothetical protein [Chloroflexota bacterium]